MEPEKQQQFIDHDLLVELRTELRGMREEVKHASDDTKERLLLMGTNKLEKDLFSDFLRNDEHFKNDHERRMRFLERYLWMAFGVVAVGEVVIGIYLTSHR